MDMDGLEEAQKKMKVSAWIQGLYLKRIQGTCI